MPRLLTALLLSCAFTCAPLCAQDLLTIAEKSDYKATSRHADVLAFCEALATKSPVVRFTDMGTSGEGRKLPLLILSDPPVSTPAQAKESGKLVVYVQANIHAGEVDGKEALLMLARDLALAADKPLLKNLVILLCPNFNPDGNEKIDPNNRRSQNGPTDGVGLRANAAGLDLNRDFVKLESPEVRAFVRMMNSWDPAIAIDCHTTNGSRHRYTLTYDGPRHPNTGTALVEAIRDKMLPEVSRKLEQKTGFKSFPYGNFSRDRTRWETYGNTPRYSTQYVGMRGRIGILSESYSYAPYKDRVTASREFVRSWFEYAADHKSEIRKLIADNKQSEPLALRTESLPLRKEKVLGYEEETKDGRRVPLLDKPKDYELELVTRVEATDRVTKPFAYLFPASFGHAVELLQRHSVTVEELREDIELDVESYRIEKVMKEERTFRGPSSVTLATAAAKPETKRIAAGTILIKTAQPLGTFASYLLEPRSEDGLATWNAFDGGLADGKDFPVVRLPKSVPLLAGAVRPLKETRTVNKPLTTESQVSFAGNAVSGLTWLDDEHFLQTKGNQQYRVNAKTGRLTPFNDPALLAKSLGSLGGGGGEARQGRRGPPRAGGGGATRMDPKRTGTLVDRENDLYFAKFDGTPAVRLTKSGGNKEIISFSPDGKFVAFYRGGNLFTVDLATQTERQLTSDGGGVVFNGKGDWVYTEEIFNRAGRAYWWSPDSSSIAYLRFDDAPVKKFTIVDHLPTRLDVESQPYPKAGDPNPFASLHVVPVASGTPKTIELGSYDPKDKLIIRAGFSPDSLNVWAYVTDRAQTWLDMVSTPVAGGTPTKLLRQTTKAWVDDPGDPFYLADGSFLLTSEKTGWKHFYRYAATGALMHPVTSGDWEIRGFGGGVFQGSPLHGVDEKGGWVYFTATKDTPTGTNLYRAKIDGSGTIERMTPEAGSHQVTVSPNGSMFIDSWSDSANPSRVVLRGSDGSVLRTLDTNPVYNREEYRFGKYERVRIPMKDGFVLEAAITRPPDFDPAKRYPVWLLTYGGPHAPTVNDGFSGGRVNEQGLASMGIVVFRCDPRSASGKGANSTWTAYKKLGVQECADVDEAIDWLCANHPWVDPKRIGMEGHSYGGYLTAYCLTHSKKFAAGIAGAPVTDWKLYDSIYTERYMNTPQVNPEGYAAGSVVRAARNLHGRLLLLHGMRDDNVHVQNSVQLVNELQRANKDFEVMFYPTARHGIGGAHYQRLKLDFIRKSLGLDSEQSRSALQKAG